MSWADLVIGAIELAVNVGAEVVDRSEQKARALKAANAGEEAANDDATGGGRFEQPQFVSAIPEPRFENPDFSSAADGNSDFEPHVDGESRGAGQAQLR